MVFDKIRSGKRAQKALGLLSGLVFGFLLQKGGLTEYDVILGQLLLTDFTVVKVMLSAILVGMVGVFVMRWRGLVRLQIKPGSIGSTALGGIIFGVGFAILGYCPGTAAAAFGAGAIDALVGMIGMVIGAGIFARLYPVLDRLILNWGAFHADTLPELIGLKPEIVAAVTAVLILGLLYLLAAQGL
ncbi:MAG TPA: YeeE/YedE thiosulfate transporter family protein [Methanothrix sp.]|nr:YeeE/YedE thiosulfate transporter family protein [Methanothrix sp.]